MAMVGQFLGGGNCNLLQLHQSCNSNTVTVTVTGYIPSTPFFVCTYIPYAELLEILVISFHL